MSTRAWYDYYVIAPDTGMLSLAMRFYKWGDGTPENALEEYVLLQGRLHQHSNRLPVEWLDRLLRKQLGNPGCIELCERDGTDVLTTLPDTTAHPDDNAWQRKQLEQLRATIREHDIGITSLALLQHEYTATPDRFFGLREQPDPEATARCARLEELRSSCNMLVGQIQKRFGPEVAATSRAIMEQIDDFDILLDLAIPTIDSADSTAWLNTLHEKVPPALIEAAQRTRELAQQTRREYPRDSTAPPGSGIPAATMA